MARIREGKGDNAKPSIIESKTYQVDVPLLGAHLDRPKLRDVEGEVRHRALRPLGSGIAGEQLPRHPRTLGDGLGDQLVDRQPPLHEGENPLPVEVGDDGGRGQPLARQVLQRLGEHLELGLELSGRDPVPPRIWLVR